MMDLVKLLGQEQFNELRATGRSCLWYGVKTSEMNSDELFALIGWMAARLDESQPGRTRGKGEAES